MLASAMEPKRLPRRSNGLETRTRMIQIGVELLSEKGFNTTAVEEILRRADVPKGSFYYFFQSKAEFGAAVIDQYAFLWEQKLTRIFYDPNVKPLQRIHNYISEGVRGLEKYQYQRGCLIGNMGQEMSAEDTEFREKILGVFQSWEKHLANCLREAIRTGELGPECDPEEIAKFFWMVWEGAILQAKLEQSVRPLENVRQVLFSRILAA